MNEVKKKITRKDVAAFAGVSETVVSYVMNENRYVNIDKRRRVQDAIKKLNYSPNPIARSLKGKNSRHIMFIADQIDNEHFGKIIKEMDKFAYEKGYIISLVSNRNDEKFIEHIIARQVDGIIISSMSFPEEGIQRLIEAGLPVVLMMNKDYEEDLKACKIYSGLYMGARDLVKYLKNKGRKNILYIDRMSQRGNFSTINDQRYGGYIAESKKLGMKNLDGKIISYCKTESEIEKRIIEKITADKSIDAIMARNDYLAMVAISAVKNMGLRVPQDISIAGFDNSTIAKFSTPSLTTVEIDRETIGKNAVDMLCDMLDGKEPTKVYVKTKFIEREST